MKYYYISVIACWMLLNIIGICVYSSVCVLSGVPLAVLSVVLLNLIVLVLWIVTVAHYDLDHRDANHIDLEREKFYAIHEFRKLHEVDHLDFTQSIYETYILNYQQDPNQGIRMKNKPKDHDSVNLEKITARILRYWFIDTETNEVKPLKKHKNVKKLISYNNLSKTVNVYKDKPIQIYTSCKDATIDLYKLQIEKMRYEWQHHVDKSMILNKEIGELLEKLDQIRNTYY